MPKTTKTEEPTTEPPSIEDRVADATKRYLEHVEQLMSHELGKRKMYWSTGTPPAVSRPVLMDLDRALRPVVKLPPPPPLVTTPPTTPPAADRAEQRRRIEEASRYTIVVADLIDQDRRRAGLPSLPDADDGADGG